jgi:hypothetical protein
VPTTIEECTAKVEGILEQMNKRLTNIEGKSQHDSYHILVVYKNYLYYSIEYIEITAK